MRNIFCFTDASFCNSFARHFFGFAPTFRRFVAIKFKLTCLSTLFQKIRKRLFVEIALNAFFWGQIENFIQLRERSTAQSYPPYSAIFRRFSKKTKLKKIIPLKTAELRSKNREEKNTTFSLKDHPYLLCSKSTNDYPMCACFLKRAHFSPLKSHKKYVRK